MIGQTRLISYSIQERLLITFFKQLGDFVILVCNQVWFSKELRSVRAYLSFQFQMSKERKRDMRFRNGFE